jgi:hypothetical protein
VRVLRASLKIFRERLLGRALGATERAGNVACDRVDHSHRWDLSPGEDIWADGQCFRRKMVMHPSVESLESSREQRDVRLGCQLLHVSLIELTSRRAQGNNSWRVFALRAIRGLEGCIDHIHAKHHASTTAVWFVIDLTGTKRREVSIAEDSEIERATEDGGHRTLLAHPGERMWHERENVDSHSVTLAVRSEAPCDHHATLTDIHLEHARTHQRQKFAIVELEYVVGRPGQYVADHTNGASIVSVNVQSN